MTAEQGASVPLRCGSTLGVRVGSGNYAYSACTLTDQHSGWHYDETTILSWARGVLPASGDSGADQ